MSPLRVAIVVGVVLGLALAAVGAAVSYLDRREVRHAGQGLSVAAASVADEIAVLLHERVRELTALARTLGRGNLSPAAAASELLGVKAESAFIFWLAATDADGRIVASTDRAAVGRDRAAAAWRLRARATEGPVLLDMEPSDDAGGAWAATVAATVADEAGTVQGTIAALIGVAPIEATVARRVSDLQAQLPGAAGVRWLLVRQDGVVLGDSTGALRGTNVREAGLRSAALSDALEGGHTEERTPGSDATMVTGYAHLSGATNAEELHWRVLLQRERADVLAPLHRTLELVGAGAAVVLLPALTALLMSRRARRRAEAGRELAHARLHAIVEHARDAIVTTDAEGTVRDFNGAAAAMFGCSRDDAVGQHLGELVTPRAVLDEYLARHQGPLVDATCELVAKQRSGEEFPVEVSIAEVKTAETTFFSAIVRDVRERKRLEMDLRQSQKLESVGQLAAGVAHEINTPIQFVGDNVRFLDESFKGVLDLVDRYGQGFDALRAGGDAAAVLEDAGRAAEEADLEFLREEIPKSITQTLDGVQRVAVIVRAMKDFAHADGKEKQAADLNQGLRSTLTIATNELKYVADVETDLGELPPLVCSIGDLNQVFLNLLVNAAHAIGDVVRDTGTKGRITVRSRLEGDAIVVAISDTGGGIPEAVRERIFDPFFTTKEVGRGSGQGLSIARRIVAEGHGGRIFFETELGRGTTFFVHLPVEPPAASIAAA